MTMRILTRSGACIAALALIGFTAAEIQAQRTSYAQSTRGTSRYSGSGAATGSRLPFSSTGRGATGGYGGSAATGAFGGQVGGMGAAGGMANPFGQTTTTGQLGQQAPMLGETGGQQFDQGGFVGRDAEDVRGTFDNLSGRDRRSMMMDMMVENFNESRESRRRWRDQQNETPPVRVRLTPSPDLAAAAAAMSAPRETGQAQSRLNLMLARRGIGAQVEIAGGTAILRGTVNSERDALLAAQLASLEPGVNNVKSELVLTPPPSAQ